MLSTALCARGPGSGCCSWPKAAVRAARTAETGPSLVLSERAHMITLWMHNVTQQAGGDEMPEPPLSAKSSSQSPDLSRRGRWTASRDSGINS
jgi:hypothetical protein